MRSKAEADCEWCASSGTGCAGVETADETVAGKSGIGMVIVSGESGECSGEELSDARFRLAATVSEAAEHVSCTFSLPTPPPLPVGVVAANANAVAPGTESDLVESGAEGTRVDAGASPRLSRQSKKPCEHSMTLTG